jgi:hypothetical protein
MTNSIDKYASRRKPRADLTGKKVGRLTVLGLTERKNNETTWLCQCDCGNTTSVNTGDLNCKENPTQSCGCARGRLSWEPLFFDDETVGIPLSDGQIAIIDACDSKRSDRSFGKVTNQQSPTQRPMRDHPQEQTITKKMSKCTG